MNLVAHLFASLLVLYLCSQGPLRWLLLRYHWLPRPFTPTVFYRRYMQEQWAMVICSLVLAFALSWFPQPLGFQWPMHVLLVAPVCVLFLLLLLGIILRPPDLSTPEKRELYGKMIPEMLPVTVNFDITLPIFRQFLC